MTPDENVFYLIIDKQRSTENVYFLNAVTEKDLLALAEKSGDTAQSTAPATPVTSEPAAEPTPGHAPQAEKDGGAGMMIFVVIVVLAGGGVAYYFKIYRPKQEQADAGEDYDEYEPDEGDPYGEDAEDDSPAWGGDETGADEYGGDDEHICNTVKTFLSEAGYTVDACLDGDENTVHTHIKNLRAKLPENNIKTVRGVGYRLEETL